MKLDDYKKTDIIAGTHVRAVISSSDLTLLPRIVNLKYLFLFQHSIRLI